MLWQKYSGSLNILSDFMNTYKIRSMYLYYLYTFKLHFFYRVGGVLIPTRSFGDFLLKSEQDKPPWKQVISAVPQIQTFHLDSQWEFVIVGKSHSLV